MDKSEKRRLKKLGKELVEKRSADLQEALKESNPAPLGSDAWMENYKTGNQNEKWLRKNLPVLHKSELEKMFVVRPDDAPGSAIEQKYKPTQGADGLLKSDISRTYVVIPNEETYIQCVRCESVLPLMRPSEWLCWKKCACGNARRARILWWYSLRIRDESQVRFVKLIGKGSATTESADDEIRKKQ